LAAVAAGAAAGTVQPQELLTALLGSTVFCEAPETPGVMTVDTPSGPVVPVFSSLLALGAARGSVRWFSTSGMDLLMLLPDGHDIVLDVAGEHPVRLRSAALRPAMEVR
jgi:hypothetical protein